MHAVLFQSNLSTTATEQIHVIVIALVYKSHSGNQIDRAGNTLKNRLTRNYIPCVGQSEIIYPVYDRAERSKIIPCPAAHPFIGQIRKYPLGLVDWFTRSRSRSLCLLRDLFFCYLFLCFRRELFFVQGGLRASSLFGAVARSRTRAARETDDASTWGGWLASLALNGELASRLYDQGIIFTSFLKIKDDERMKDGKFCWLLILVCVTLFKYEPSNYMAPLSMSSP